MVPEINRRTFLKTTLKVAFVLRSNLAESSPDPANPRYGIAGYPETRPLLGLSPKCLVYSWGFHPEVNDPYLLRQSVVFDNNQYVLRPGISEFVKKHPEICLYTSNEPTYEGNYYRPRPTARRLAELTQNLVEIVGPNGRVYTPGFSGVELGQSWWGDLREDLGPDGKMYDFAESYIKWMKALYGNNSCPKYFSFHAYPPPGEDGHLNEIIKVIHAVLRMVERNESAFPPDLKLALTEVGLIDATCAGYKHSKGWDKGKRQMEGIYNILETSFPIITSACWFIPRSEACGVEGGLGGWPGYLIYSQFDPNGKKSEEGRNPVCGDYYFSWSQMCVIERGVGTPDSLTPLGELLKQIASRPKSYKLFIPYLR